MARDLVIPSALIQASGLQSLSLSELRLFWRLVDELSAEDLPEDTEGVTVRLSAGELWESGEKDSFRLLERLEAVSAVSLRFNLDGRDGNDLWRMKLSLLPEYEIRQDVVEMFVGPRMYRAIRERKTFTTIREAVLFNMRGSRYSAILYTLIRDKANQTVPEWEIDLPMFRKVMQVAEKAYPSFKDLRVWVIEPAVKEVSEKSEYIVTIDKGRTHRNQVRSVVIRWELKDRKTARKTEKEIKRHSVAQGKTQEATDAPPLVESDPQHDLDDLARAVAWVDGLFPDEREELHRRFQKLEGGYCPIGRPAWKLAAWRAETEKPAR